MNNALQAAAMDGELRYVVTGIKPALLVPDLLSVAGQIEQLISADGGIVEDWNVKYFPTIYVIDGKGVIRHKDKRGDDLEKAVNELLKEQEEKKGTN